MSFRPLSARGKEDARFDGLHEGLPIWLHQPVLDWFEPFVYERLAQGHEFYDGDYLQDLQARLRLRPPLNWFSVADAWADLQGRMLEGSGRTGIDVIDYALNFLDEHSTAKRVRLEKVRTLTHLLAIGGSVWEPTPVVDGSTWMLTRRGTGPVREAATSVAEANARVGLYLSQAWSRAFGRQPDPSGAYREAVRAVEAAARPVVSPEDPVATLGKMIRAIEDKPSKWEFELGSPTDVSALARVLWSSQLDRHGTDDEAVPLSVSQEQADAAVHTAITLSQYFVTGAFKRVE